jgi:hypothetical protein
MPQNLQNDPLLCQGNPRSVPSVPLSEACLVVGLDLPAVRHVYLFQTLIRIHPPLTTLGTKIFTIGLKDSDCAETSFGGYSAHAMDCLLWREMRRNGDDQNQRPDQGKSEVSVEISVFFDTPCFKAITGVEIGTDGTKG